MPSRIAGGACTLLFTLSCLWLQSACAGADRPERSDVQPRVVAYLAGWSVPPVIHPDKLTHINFAFAHVDKTGHVVVENPAMGTRLRDLQRLKKQNPALKILVSVGGWQAEGFSDAALTESSRRTFAHSAVRLLREYALDGIDLDWEYPGQGVAGIKYRTEDKQNFTLLLQALRAHVLGIESGPGWGAAGCHFFTGRAAPGSTVDPPPPASLGCAASAKHVLTPTGPGIRASASGPRERVVTGSAARGVDLDDIFTFSGCRA